MSLVIAYIGKGGSVVAGDMREITLWGDSPGSDQFEQELYSGQIHTDDEMRHRAQELGIHLRIHDTKRKVHEREGILIGEVTDFEQGIMRTRRIYVTTGKYALAEIESRHFIRIQWGGASRFVILGNPFTQQITNECIQEHWKGGGVTEAIHLVEVIMTIVAQKSASVSRGHLLLKTVTTTDLGSILEKDQKY